MFSSTKGATAICGNLLVQRGLLDLDAPVTDYWPEFKQNGKDSIPVRWLFCHKSGLPTVDERLPLEKVLEWDPIVKALERQEPLWEPGSAHGYHAITYGWLLGELIRRVDGRSLSDFFADEVAQPLGLEFWIGLPESEEPRVAPLIGDLLPNPDDIPEDARAIFEQFAGPNSLLHRALSLNDAFDIDAFNTRAVHASELGAVSGITNARSLSRMYAGVIGPLSDAPSAPLFTDAQLAQARELQTDDTNDRVIFAQTTFGLGFMLSGPFSPFGGPGSFGHPGVGGSVGFADPDNGVAFGYVMNRLMQNLSNDPRTRTLVKATYAAIGADVAFP